MKKKKLSSLSLNKKTVSNLSIRAVIGGTDPGSNSCGVCPLTTYEQSCYTTTDYTIPYTDLCARTQDFQATCNIPCLPEIA